MSWVRLALAAGWNWGNAAISEYGYSSAEACQTDAYVWPVAIQLIETALVGHARRVFDLGCGNGAFAAALAARSIDVTGVDVSQSGIAAARLAHPSIKFAVGSAYDDLAATYGSFPVVVSLEVVEHLYDPRRFAQTALSLLEPGGTAIISTPFHGYWKNLALALTNKMDWHYTALWDHGHIKFWSEATLGKLLTETGFRNVRFERVGRLRPFAKSMLAVATRPATKHQS